MKYIIINNQGRTTAERLAFRYSNAMYKMATPVLSQSNVSHFACSIVNLLDGRAALELPDDYIQKIVPEGYAEAEDLVRYILQARPIAEQDAAVNQLLPRLVDDNGDELPLTTVTLTVEQLASITGGVPKTREELENEGLLTPVSDEV